MTDDQDVRLAYTDNPALRHLKQLGWISRRALRAHQEKVAAEAALETRTDAPAPDAPHHAWVDKALLRGIPVTGAGVGGASRYTRPGDCTRCARMGRRCPACASERRNENGPRS